MKKRLVQKRKPTQRGIWEIGFSIKEDQKNEELMDKPRGETKSTEFKTDKPKDKCKNNE